MNILTTLMRVIERGISGAVMLIGLTIVVMGFITSSQLHSSASQGPSGPIELARPLNDPQMAAAYRQMKASGDVKSEKEALTDADKYLLNQVYESIRLGDAARDASRETFGEQSGDWGSGGSR